MAVSIIPAAGIILRAHCGATFMSWRPNFVGMASLSGRPAAAAAWLTMFTILTGLVKAASFENVSIVGHSTGGMVSLTYAGVFP